MMYKSKTRLASLFLAFVLLFGILPVSLMTTASAANGFTLYVNSTTKDDTATRADKATYKTLGGAIDKAVSGDTIILNTDISESSVFITDLELTIDFNGHVLTLSSTSYGMDVDGTAKLTLKDSSGDNSGGMKHSRTQVECILLEGAATVTIESGSYTSSYGYCVEAASGSTGQVIINGGSFTAVTSCVYNNGDTARIFLNDGTFLGNINGANSGVLLTPTVLDKVYGKNNLYNNIYIHFPSGSHTLTKDVDLHDWQLRVLDGEDTTIDLNGFNITGNGMMKAPTEGGTVTIGDINNLSCLIQVHEAGKLTFKNTGTCDNSHGRIHNDATPLIYIIKNYGELTLDGNLRIDARLTCSSEKTQSGAVYIDSMTYSPSDMAVLTVNNGVEITAKKADATPIYYTNGILAASEYGASGMTTADRIKITINGGTIYGDFYAMSLAGTLTINGGTFKNADTATSEVFYIGYPAANLTGISNANFIGNELAMFIGEQAFQSDTITIHNTTINGFAGKPITTAIAQQGTNKNVIITGKDTYWVANAITSFCEGTIQIHSGIFSADPTAYVPVTDGAKDYAVLDYTNETVSHYYLVAPWTAVGTDNKVNLYYAAGATTASDGVSINAINDTESIIPDTTRVQARHFTLSSEAGEFKSIDGLSVTGFTKGTTLTVEKTKACPATEAYVWYGGKNVGMIVIEATNEPTHDAPAYDVSGEITGAVGKPTAYLIRDGVKYPATVSSAGNSYHYVVADVPTGIYDLVVSSAPAESQTENTITTTVLVKIINQSITQNVALPQSVYNSIVTTVGDKTPNVEAGGLDTMAKTVGTPTENTYVLIELKVAENEDSDRADDVNAAIANDGMIKGILMDTDVLQTVNSAPPVEITEIDPALHGVSLITVVFHLPKALQGKDGYAIFRYHGMQVDKITETVNENGESMTVNAEKDTITAQLNRFSTYSIAYTGKYTVTFDANGGSVTPTSATTNNKLDTLPTPTRGGNYSFDGWYTSADGGTLVTADTVFTGDATLYAHWTYREYPGSSDDGHIIAATAGAGGTVSPSGSVPVRENLDKTFTFTPDAGYVVSDVLVDGVSVGAVASYTFQNIQKNHTIKVIFTARGDAIGLDKVNHFAYMQGYVTGEFGPNKNMTRAEAIVMFSRLLLEKMDMEKSYSCSFSDITGGEWYANAVGYMERFGIISGYLDGTFGGNKPITRAEFAAISTRFDALLLDKPNPFSDVAATHWARDYIASAADRGWITGYTDGTFRPENHITRAEVVTIVNHMLERKADGAFVLAHQDMVDFTDLQNVEDWYYYDIVEASIGHKYERNADGVELWTSIQK